MRKIKGFENTKFTETHIINMFLTSYMILTLYLFFYNLFKKEKKKNTKKL